MQFFVAKHALSIYRPNDTSVFFAKHVKSLSDVRGNKWDNEIDWACLHVLIRSSNALALAKCEPIIALRTINEPLIMRFTLHDDDRGFHDRDEVGTFFPVQCKCRNRTKNAGKGWWIGRWLMQRQNPHFYFPTTPTRKNSFSGTTVGTGFVSGIFCTVISYLYLVCVFELERS